MTKIISIGTFKGGVGKTITVFNVAGILAELGYKVLCIDVDPQGNLTKNCDVNRAVKNFNGAELIFDVKKHSLNKILIKSPIKEIPNLDIIPSSIWLHQSEFRLALAPARELKLKYFLEDNKKQLTDYDYILIDTNPSMGYLNQNAFVVSDKIIIPATPDESDIDGINLFCLLWDSIRNQLRLKDNIAAVVVTRYDVRNAIDKRFIHYIKTSPHTEVIKTLLLDTVIPTNVTLKNSANAHLPINLYDKNSNGYIAYHKLVNELLMKGVL